MKIEHNRNGQTEQNNLAIKLSRCRRQAEARGQQLQLGSFARCCRGISTTSRSWEDCTRGGIVAWKIKSIKSISRDYQVEHSRFVFITQNDAPFAGMWLWPSGMVCEKGRKEIRSESNSLDGSTNIQNAPKAQEEYTHEQLAEWPIRILRFLRIYGCSYTDCNAEETFQPLFRFDTDRRTFLRLTMIRL